MKYFNYNNISYKQCCDEIYFNDDTLIENKPGAYQRYIDMSTKKLFDTYCLSNVKCSMFLTGFKIIDNKMRLKFTRKLHAIKKI